MKIPYIDLKRQYSTIKTEIDRALQETIESSAFVAGAKVHDFETHYAAYCGTKHAIGISSGTSALYVSLKALSVGDGDIVITVPFTFIATVEAITLTRARPVFVDIDPDTYTISVNSLKAYIKDHCIFDPEKRILHDRILGMKVKAIMPVHLYGQIADMDEIMDIAHEYGLYVLEDAAQAHGARYKNKRAGSLGHIACFSFYPSKNLGAYGQGGAILTDDARFAEEVRLFINHGQQEKYRHEMEGWNFKMDGFQAAVLDVKLKHLDEWNRVRQQNAHVYNEQLEKCDSIVLPVVKPNRDHVYHLYVIRVSDRHSFQEYLNKSSIGFTVAYPIPLHLQQAYASLQYHKGDFPVAEQVADEVIGLPIFPELSKDELYRVCECVTAWSECR